MMKRIALSPPQPRPYKKKTIRFLETKRHPLITRFLVFAKKKDGNKGLTYMANRQTKAKDFEGAGGPEDKAAQAANDRGGDNNVTVNTKNKN